MTHSQLARFRAVTFLTRHLALVKRGGPGDPKDDDFRFPSKTKHGCCQGVLRFGHCPNEGHYRKTMENHMMSSKDVCFCKPLASCTHSNPVILPALGPTDPLTHCICCGCHLPSKSEPSDACTIPLHPLFGLVHLSMVPTEDGQFDQVSTGLQVHDI